MPKSVNVNILQPTMVADSRGLDDWWICLSCIERGICGSWIHARNSLCSLHFCTSHWRNLCVRLPKKVALHTIEFESTCIGVCPYSSHLLPPRLPRISTLVLREGPDSLERKLCKYCLRDPMCLNVHKNPKNYYFMHITCVYIYIIWLYINILYI